MEPPGWVFTDLQLLLSLTELLLGAACCAVRCSRPVEQPHALGVGGRGAQVLLWTAHLSTQSVASTDGRPHE